MSHIELIMFMIVMLILTPFTAFTLIKFVVKKWFTPLETGNIKHIYRGDTLRKIIADVRGKKLVGHKLVPGTEEKTWYNKLGLYWMGISIPGISEVTVKKFKIEKKKEEEKTEGKESTEWIKDLGSAEVDSLRATFPRPFLLTNVELGDRQTVTLLVVTMLDVVDADIPVPRLKGDFFGNTSSTLRAAINDILKSIPSMEDFVKAPKGEGGILSELENSATGTISNFNQKLEKQVGLHLVGAAISEWDPSDEKIREAMNLKFIAEKQQETEIIAAETYKKQLGITNEADALAAERLAKARGIRVKETLEALASKGANAESLVQAAAKILQAESLVNLTTYVEGGGASAVVPIGGK